MEDKSETMDQAKNKAKLAAELDVIEQIKFNVESYSNLHNSNLTKDEVVIITAGIMNVKKVEYSLRADSDDVLILKATVTADVDTDKIPELVEREVKCRHSKQ